MSLSKQSQSHEGEPDFTLPQLMSIIVDRMSNIRVWGIQRIWLFVNITIILQRWHGLQQPDKSHLYADWKLDATTKSDIMWLTFRGQKFVYM